MHLNSIEILSSALVLITKLIISEAVTTDVPQKKCSEKSNKIHRKTMRWHSFLVNYNAGGKANIISRTVETQPFADVLQKSAVKNFTIFTGKHLYRGSLCLSKVAGLIPATLLKKRLRYRWFRAYFRIIFKNTFFTELLRMTLLKAIPEITCDGLPLFFFPEFDL